MRSLMCAALLLLLPLPSPAQSTQRSPKRTIAMPVPSTRDLDARAETLCAKLENAVYRAEVRPHPIRNSERFWYRNRLPKDRTEFVLVDPTVPRKMPAFDHARVAAALTKILGKPVQADRLPVRFLLFEPDGKTLLLAVDEQTFACDLTTYALTTSERALMTAPPLAPGDAPATSPPGNGETSLSLLNRTPFPVRVFWRDFSGNLRPYGSLLPGRSQGQRTYAGHVFEIRDESGKPLVAFVAPEESATAVIAAPFPEAAAVSNRPAPPLRTQEDRPSVFVRNFNVYLRTEEGTDLALTTDGTAGNAYEGEPVWSPDRSKFVLLRTEPAQEHKVVLVESSPADQVQPRVRTIDYLKPGDRIAHSRPALFDVATRLQIPIRDEWFPNPWEISRIDWEPDGSRFRFLYNQRGHQVIRWLAVDAVTGAVRPIVEETAKTFIDWSGKTFLRPLDETREAILMSERDGWNHLYLYNTDTGTVKAQITRGSWVVRGVEDIDEAKRRIRFTASGIVPGQDPYLVHHCRVNFDGTGLTVLTDGDGDHTLSVLPGGRYAVDTFSRVDAPPVTVLRDAETGKTLLPLETADLTEWRKAGGRLPERFVAKGRDRTTDIFGIVHFPHRFDPTRRYPVIEAIYAGPQAAHVPKRFSPAYRTIASLNEAGFFVVRIDGMGTSFRSKAFHDVCWKNLADAGFPDRIPWIKAAAERWPQMDLSRVGIYGTSAGGQNALGGLLQHGDFYRAGVADCGCHDNRMDKIWWNEQWMGWPVGEEYAAQSNVTMAPKLTGKLLLLVGETDTNVDPASTMQVVNALIKADRDFEMLVVPGADHGVLGIPYVRRRMIDFFLRCFPSPARSSRRPDKAPGLTAASNGGKL
ncbi:MAG: prolyl oligopeptidase family serine peptidase [Capsulimonadales bacterium]|nr:prolyl oligopeptidase family serine peptidase [Capsulimonadales bacterium]